MKGTVLDDKALIMAETDTVATALDDLEAGTELPVGTDASANGGADGATDHVVLTESIGFGHKFALDDIDAGDMIYKYGEVIGEATADVPAGAWVHTHNCESRRGRVDLEDATAMPTGGDPR